MYNCHIRICFKCGNKDFYGHDCQKPNHFCQGCGHHFYMGHHGGIGTCPKCNDDRVNRM